MSIVDFKSDIIEMRNFGMDVLVILEDLQMFYVLVSPTKLIKHYAGMVNPLADSPVQRIKYTSLAISSKSDFGLLSVFTNSMVVLYISKTNEESKTEEGPGKLESTRLKIESTYKYYEFRVNSSLITMENDKAEEFIWHLDDEHRLIRNKISRSKYGDVEITTENN